MVHISLPSSFFSVFDSFSVLVAVGSGGGCGVAAEARSGDADEGGQGGAK